MGKPAKPVKLTQFETLLLTMLSGAGLTTEALSRQLEGKRGVQDALWSLRRLESLKLAQRDGTVWVLTPLGCIRSSPPV